MEIPPSQLSEHALNALIEEYVSREGTDYGTSSFSFEQKTQQVRAQIDQGQVLIVYDDESQSCNLLTKDELKR